MVVITPRQVEFFLKPERRTADSIIGGALIFLAFGVVYAFSLSFVYIEGDDASTVAHHVLGRNSQMQPVYSPYQSMLDAVLSLLPAREDLLRVGAMSLTALAVPVLFLLIVILAFDWCGDMAKGPKWPLVAVMLLVVPEFYYLGMVLTPSVIAMTLLVGGHLILRRSLLHAERPRWLGFGASLPLFAIGAAFRWDTIAYGATIVADLFLSSRAHRESGGQKAWRRLQLPLLWGGLAGAGWLITLNLNGYEADDVLRSLLTGAPVESFDWMLAISRIHTLFTPAFLVLGVAGLFLLSRHRHPLALLAILAILPVARFILYGVPKWMITIIPTSFACAMAGLMMLWGGRQQRYAVLALAFLPWLIGVRMNFAGGAWGPGFELQSYNALPATTSWPSLTLGAGMALPTPEGPRGLFGHAWIFGAAWRRFVVQYWAEQDNAVRKAFEMRVPLLQQDGENWGAMAYAARGYKTTDPYNRMIDNNFVVERRWHGPNGAVSRMFSFVQRKSLFDPESCRRFRDIVGSTVIISGFSSTLGQLHAVAPESLAPLGKVTAVLDLDRLCKDLYRTSLPA